jgi:hypothetical protein
MKITHFFPTLLPGTAHRPNNIAATQPHHATKPHTSLTAPSSTKRNLRRILLTYNRTPIPPMSLHRFTRPLPRYELYYSWGHSLPIVDNISTFRLFLQNPNGLCLTTKPHSLQNDLIQCRNYGNSVICLPETNVNWDIPH